MHAEYEGCSLIADPIHRYVPFTVPRQPGEATEKDLIDSPWFQRLRYIYQLQSARWVYPSAEHSRFQHCLGAMHLAGALARRLYPSLRRALGDDCPSPAYVEEYMRVTGLLHDIGHGPFCHFFDHNFLSRYGLIHEDVSQVIIRDRLGDLIRQLRRSPNGAFAAGEELDPDEVAFPIKKDGADDHSRPRWLRFLQPLTNGVFTFDNLDYVSRDSYMCGVAVGPIDRERLIYYTFFSPKGLTLHRSGDGALTVFLNARKYLYENVYFHRTTRAIDLHLQDLFPETMEKIAPGNPLDHLDEYLYLTDWSLLQEVSRWRRKGLPLGREWGRVLDRDLKWRLAYEKTLQPAEMRDGLDAIAADDWEGRIRGALPAGKRDLTFRVDMATQDSRPQDPLAMGKKQIHTYDPSTDAVTKESLAELFGSIPSKIVKFRVFALDHANDRLLARHAEQALREAGRRRPR